MDIPDTDLIIQFGLPSSIENYAHRVGRTSRVGGLQGESILLLHKIESWIIEKIAKHFNEKIPLFKLRSDAPLPPFVLAPKVIEDTSRSFLRSALGFYGSERRMRDDGQKILEYCQEFMHSLNIVPDMIPLFVANKMGVYADILKRANLVSSSKKPPSKPKRF